MIEYTFTMDNGEVHSFQVELDQGATPSKTAPAPAPWTDLDFNKCTNCPLQAQQQPRCPAAVDVEAIAQKFSNIKSFEKVKVEVKTKERIYVKHCDAQTGLRALLGLVMANSACPIISQLKGLTHFHLPFATPDESLFRSASAYLIKQYFVHKAGGVPDWNLTGLGRLYEELQTVNGCFKQRLYEASTMDANLNAVCSLSFISTFVAYSLEEELEKLKPHFAAEP